MEAVRRRLTLLCATGAGGCLLAAALAYGWSGLRTAVGIAATMALYALIVRVLLVLRWPGRLVLLVALGWVPGVMFGLVVGSVTDRWVTELGFAAGLLAVEALVHRHER
jgi:hypothetical protein